MKLNSIYITGLLAMILMSCNSKYNYWDISKFNINNDALENNEEIKLIYSSRGPDYKEEFEYYIHLIVVSQRTGDTVNVLTTVDNGITMDEKDKVFNFFNEDNVVSKLIQMDIEDIMDIKNMDDINKIETKKIDKVARDPNFDYIADNDFPTIIGSIGTTTKNSN